MLHIVFINIILDIHIVLGKKNDMYFTGQFFINIIIKDLKIILKILLYYKRSDCYSVTQFKIFYIQVFKSKIYRIEIFQNFKYFDEMY